MLAHMHQDFVSRLPFDAYESDHELSAPGAAMNVLLEQDVTARLDVLVDSKLANSFCCC